MKLLVVRKHVDGCVGSWARVSAMNSCRNALHDLHSRLLPRPEVEDFTDPARECRRLFGWELPIKWTAGQRKVNQSHASTSLIKKHPLPIS